MKKVVPIVLAVVLNVVLLVLAILFVFLCIVPFLGIVKSQENSPETFITSSQSPDGEYILEAYRTEPGATVDFSIKVYEVTGNTKTLIYDAYHESDVQIFWIDNTIVSINSKKLDLSSGQTYDWRDRTD